MSYWIGIINSPASHLRLRERTGSPTLTWNLNTFKCDVVVILFVYQLIQFRWAGFQSVRLFIQQKIILICSISSNLLRNHGDKAMCPDPNIMNFFPNHISLSRCNSKQTNTQNLNLRFNLMGRRENHPSITWKWFNRKGINWKFHECVNAIQTTFHSPAEWNNPVTFLLTQTYCMRSYCSRYSFLPLNIINLNESEYIYLFYLAISYVSELCFILFWRQSIGFQLRLLLDAPPEDMNEQTSMPQWVETVGPARM